MSNKTTNIVKTCVMCNNTYKLEVKTNDLHAYMRGNKSIQNAFPYLSAGDRELIISGICNTCYEKLMVDDEAEENMPESYEYNNRD